MLNIKFRLQSTLLDDDNPLIESIAKVASELTEEDSSLEEILFGKEMSLDEFIT
jgi:hypothetical protein